MFNKSYLFSLGLLFAVNLFYVCWKSYDVGFLNAYIGQFYDPFCWGLGFVGLILGFIYNFGE